VNEKVCMQLFPVLPSFLILITKYGRRMIFLARLFLFCVFRWGRILVFQEY